MRTRAACITLLALLLALPAEASEWIYGFVYATVTYRDGGQRRKLKVVSDLTSYCFRDQNSSDLKKAFEQTVSSNYSRFAEASISMVLWQVVNDPDPQGEYSGLSQRKDGHDEVVRNGFVNTAYSTKCKR